MEPEPRDPLAEGLERIADRIETNPTLDELRAAVSDAAKGDAGEVNRLLEAFGRMLRAASARREAEAGEGEGDGDGGGDEGA